MVCHGLQPGTPAISYKLITTIMCILSNGAILSIANIHLAFGCPTANSLRLVLLSLPPLTVKFPTTLALPNPQGRRRASRRPARRPTVRSTPPVRTPASDPTKTASERPAGRRRRPGGYIDPPAQLPPKNGPLRTHGGPAGPPLAVQTGRRRHPGPCPAGPSVGGPPPRNNARPDRPSLTSYSISSIIASGCDASSVSKPVP